MGVSPVGVSCVGVSGEGHVFLCLLPLPPQVRVGTPEALGAVAGAMGGARAGALLLPGVPGGGQRLRVQRIGEEYRALR